MKFIIYSDKNYEYQVNNFLDSLNYSQVNDDVVYFTLGFKSSIEKKGLIKIEYPINESLPKFEFYKPFICLEALKLFDDDFCYVDSDIILSKRFKDFNFDFSVDHPMSCKGPIEYPYIYYGSEENFTVKNETKLMNYFGVKERKMFYNMSCFFTFNKNSMDFLEEWSSICENKYLLKNYSEYFPFTDETALNVLYWKRNVTNNYGHKFINTHKFSTFDMCENGDRITQTLIDDNMYEYCHDSNEVYFYHGFKEVDVVNKFNLIKL
jgi:hypothetical protein